MGGGKRRAALEGTEQAEEDLIGPQALAGNEAADLSIGIEGPENGEENRKDPTAKQKQRQALLLHGAERRMNPGISPPLNCRLLPQRIETGAGSCFLSPMP